MALFSIEIADSDVNRVIDAVCSNYSRQETVSNPNFDHEQEESEENPRSIPNPENSFKFANRIVREFLAEHVRAYEVEKAKAQAVAAANTTVDIVDPA